MKLFLLALACLVCVASSLGSVHAQQEGRIYKLGWLTIGSASFVDSPVENWTGSRAAFRDELRQRGFVAGKNLVIDLRHGSGEAAKLGPIAADFVAKGVDVIVTAGTPATKAAKEATKLIPIVFLGAAAPVERGLVQSLSKPGGNVTGMSVDVAFSKPFQLIRDVLPSARRAATLDYKPNMTSGELLKSYIASGTAAAAANGYEWSSAAVSHIEEIEPLLAGMAASGPAALIISSDSTLFSWREQILKMAAKYRVLTVCTDLNWSLEGCAVTHGDDNAARFRRAAEMVAKVLKGAPPSEIPVEQPAALKLVVNANVLRTLNIPVPSAILALADEVIE